MNARPISPCGGVWIGCRRVPLPEPSAPLLLVEGEARARTCLQRTLSAKGFAVIGVISMKAAMEAAAATPLAYAVTELRLGDGHGLVLIKQLLELHASMRIVVVTCFDSFASVILALHAGAVDYFPKPVVESELIDALLGHAPMLPLVSKTPLTAARIR